MRIGRLILGFVLIVFALWIIVGEQITGVSSDAVVNARMTTVRAPIAGEVTMPFRPFGARVSRDEELAAISDKWVDSTRLSDLEMEREFASEEARRLSDLIEQVRSEIAELTTQTEAYRSAHIGELELRLRHARDRLALLETEYDPNTEAAKRTNLSRKDGTESIWDTKAGSIAISNAREEVDLLVSTLTAFRAQIYFTHTYNDGLQSQQKQRDTKLELERLLVQASTTAQRLASIEKRLTQEKQRVSQFRNAALISPANGALWEVLAADRETVQRGQDVMRVIDCDSAIVTLSVHDTVYDRIRVGQAAKFRLNGDREVYPGTVTRIAGPGAATIYRNLAVAPSEKHLQRYDVTLMVPALRNIPELRCAVGRSGRAFFDTRPLDWFRSIWR